MATYIVDRVHREACPAGGRHIAGVCTYPSGGYHSRAAVVASIRAGDAWYTHAGGGVPGARIHPIAACPRCRAATPYITTQPDGLRPNNLDALPDC